MGYSPLIETSVSSIWAKANKNHCLQERRKESDGRIVGEKAKRENKQTNSPVSTLVNRVTETCLEKHSFNQSDWKIGLGRLELPVV